MSTSSSESKFEIIRAKLFPFDKLNRSQKYYLLSIHLFILLAVSCIFSSENFKTYMMVPVSIMALGIISDFLAIYNKLWETSLGRAVLLLLYAALTTFTYAITSLEINEVIKFEVSSLTYTTNFVAILSAPLLALKGVTIILMSANLLTAFYLMYLVFTSDLNKEHPFHEIFPQHKESYPLITVLIRFTACLIMVSTLEAYDKKNSDDYMKSIETATSWFLYNVEAMPYSRCEIPKDARVLKVNDNEIVIVDFKEGVYRFTPSKCIPIIKQ